MNHCQDTLNTYRIRTFLGFPTRQLASFPASRLVTFTAHDGYPLPNPYLFRLHAAISHILDASGMGSLIEQGIREHRDRRFAEDSPTGA